MATYRPLPDAALAPVDDVIVNVSPSPSAVSWAAIFVGAAAAAVLSLLLVILGFGLGLSAISPWSNSGISAQSIGISTILWIAFTQLAAASMGGYLAGRLRTRWVSLHTDETYFRDTAHGFMAWAVATLGTAVLLGSVLTSVVSGGVQAVSNVAGGAAQAVASATSAAASDGSDQSGVSSRLDYFVDSMFRKTGTTATSNPGAPSDAAGEQASAMRTAPAQLSAATRGEAVKIFAHDIQEGSMPDADRQYLGQIVSHETGISQSDAEQRVSGAYTQITTAITQAKTKAKEAADAARKAAAYSALWMFVALLIGAFFASFAATFGGRRRDQFE